jgi:hypothetical protein
MQIELLYFPGCPHALAYRVHLDALVRAAGVTDPVRLVCVDDDEEVRVRQFLGSPTVRINGRDVDPSAERRSDYAMSCRLYPTQGGLAGRPPDDWVLSALRQALSP